MKTIIQYLKIILDRRQWRNIIILFVIMFFGAIIESLGIILLPTLLSGLLDINKFATNKYIAFLLNNFSWSIDEAIIFICIFLIALYIFKGLYSTVQYYLLYRFLNNNRYQMQSKLMRSYLSREYDYYLNLRSGDVIQNLTNNVDYVFTAITSLMNFCSELIMVVVILATVIIINPIFAIGIGLLLLLLMWVVSHYIKPIMAREGKNVTASYANMNKWIMQAVAGIKEIKIEQKEWFFCDNYSNYARIAAKSRRSQSFSEQIPRVVFETVTMVAMLLILLFIYLFSGNFNELIPQFAAFGVAIIKIIPSANRISTYRNSMEYYSQGIKEVSEFIDDTNSKAREEFFGKDEETNSVISFRKECGLYGVTYKYPQGDKEVFEDITVNIPKGKSVGIIGPSGAGKSTIADLLLGLIKPKSGEVKVDGIDIEFDYKGWLKHIGYIPQTIYMLDDTIRENVVFGGGANQSDDKVWGALDEACIGDFVRSLPEGLDTNIGERGVRLSGGQRQRIGIARALFNSPDLLVFDEATSALDNETENAIIESIERLHGKNTLIIIAHRLSTIDKCDIIYKISDGKISIEKEG